MIRGLAWAGMIVAALALAAGFAIRAPDADVLYLPVVAVPFALVGWLLATRRRDNPIGWLFLSFGTAASLNFAAERFAERALEARPPAAGADVAAALAAHLWHPFFGLFVFSFLLFPDGRLLSRRWRGVAGVSLVTYAGLALSAPFEGGYLPEEFPGARPLFDGTLEEVATAVYQGLLSFNLLLLPLSGASLVVRLRRSSGRQREQVKVFVYAVAAVMFAFPVLLLATGAAYGVLLFPLIPISAGVAILRYRLFDIDVVIRRTLVYGALTLTLGAVYLALVLTVGLAVGRSSDLAIAASTLAVAGLFRPARGRIQGLVDHRFYRRRYDAGRTLEAFGARLRDEVDLETLGADLRGVVAETVQPTHATLWLREGRS